MTPSVSLSTLRIAGRISLNFVLEQVELGRSDRDLTDDLILLTIVQANVEPISRDIELQRAYATIDDPPPDDLRRPVSISSVANALRLPYETVRRRATQMAAEGICDITPRGVYVSSLGLNSPTHRAVLEGSYEMVRLFYLRLRKVGFLNLAESNVAPWGGPKPPVRAVARASSDYFLRLMEPVTQNIGDVLTGLILLDIVRANTEGLRDTERGTDDYGVDGFVRDEKRRPVSVATLSTRLNVPHETVRRHVAQLLVSRQCVRTPGGVVMTAEALARSDTLRVVQANHIHVHRMFSMLSQLGVLADWDQGASDERAANRDAEVA